MVVFCVLLSLAGCSSVQVGARPEEPEGTSSLGSLVLEDVDGRPVLFSEHAGRDVILVSFWATFCKPCKSEMPFLQKIHESYGEKGVFVVSISLDGPETEALVRPFVERNRYTFRVCLDRQSEATQLLNPKSVLPHLLVFDRAGEVVVRKDGFSVGDQAGLEEMVKGLVGGDP